MSMDRGLTVAEQVRDCIAKSPKTVKEIMDDTGISEQQVRRVLGVAEKFCALTITRDPSSGLFRYGLSK